MRRMGFQDIGLAIVVCGLLVWTVRAVACSHKPAIDERKRAVVANKEAALIKEIYSSMPQTVQSREAAVKQLVAILREAGKPVSLRNANLSELNLSGVDLSSADLVGADLSSANLVGADLQSAQFSDCNHSHFDAATGWSYLAAKLRNADLENAILGNAALCGADISGAKLVRAKQLTQEQVDSMTGNEETEIPSELIRPPSWVEASP